MGSIPDQGTNILHAVWCGKKQKKKQKKTKNHQLAKGFYIQRKKVKNWENQSENYLISSCVNERRGGGSRRGHCMKKRNTPQNLGRHWTWCVCGWGTLWTSSPDLEQQGWKEALTPDKMFLFKEPLYDLCIRNATKSRSKALTEERQQKS